MRWLLRGAIGTLVVALSVVILAALVLFGGGGSCISGVTAPSSTTATPGEVVRYFESQGLTPFAAAGIAGNLQQESGLDPQAAGGGLAQWNPTWYAQMAAYATSQGLSPASIAGQLLYVSYELHGGAPGDDYSTLTAALNAASSPQQAAIEFQNGYEQCQGAGPAGTLAFYPGAPCDTPDREQYAIQALAASAPSTVPVSLPLAGVACAETSGGQAAMNVLALAQAAIGGPYSQANHATAFDQTAGWVQANGTDCSGFASWLMGPQGLGIWSEPYTTPAIPTAPDMQRGQGAQITLWNNPAAGDAGHVWLEILGLYYASEGGVGIHQLPPSEVQTYLASGLYSPWHPTGM
jgi:Phage tail lysozyme